MNETAVAISVCIFTFSLFANLGLYLRLRVWRDSQRELILKLTERTRSLKIVHQCLLEATAKGILVSEQYETLKEDYDTLTYRVTQKKPRKPKTSKKKGNTDETGTGKDK